MVVVFGNSIVVKTTGDNRAGPAGRYSKGNRAPEPCSKKPFVRHDNLFDVGPSYPVMEMVDGPALANGAGLGSRDDNFEHGSEAGRAAAPSGAVEDYRAGTSFLK
jgi:hypothetical protein